MKQQFRETPITVKRTPKTVVDSNGIIRRFSVPTVRLIVTKRAHVRKPNPEERVGFTHRIVNCPKPQKRSKSKRR